ncbi:MAG: hypothetical protein KAS23_08910 [Anaerohalosphaera sp.]|nr:hypothetical protein [Anaerohalosphaera sp.]
MENKFTAISPDTSFDAAKVQWEIFRNMSGSERVDLACRLSEDLRATVIAGIKHRHPDYTHAQTIKAYLSLIIDKEILDEAMPNIEATP